jgi:branched-chain amino acid transport system ATP-binding protein
MPMHEDVLLEVKDLCVTFGGLKAVDNFSMKVRRGSIHALIGPNGAGKSTTFNCISRYHQPAAGSIVFEGHDLRLRSPSQMAGLGIARTFQNLELFGELSALDNVLIGAHAHAAKGWLGALASYPEDKIAFAKKLLRDAGLSGCEDTRACDLDFGRQKLLELARASAIKPKLLLLDEPAAGLRNDEIKLLDKLLVRMARELGMTVLLVEHVMELVMGISDRVTVLSFGRKIAEGTPREVVNNPQVIESYLGSTAVQGQHTTEGATHG